MITKIVFKDDQHLTKKAVITIEKGGQKSMEFFPACKDDDKETGSYAEYAKRFFNYIIDDKF
ncbi:MAG: hypothetical protein LBS69_00175 [Prevotellaceae bacterium]|jgi:hypothetical protein|nr:hypothetical protein [Prevotellaceae bacterium]